jgi:hypothetical protein
MDLGVITTTATTAATTMTMIGEAGVRLHLSASR